jgi:6-phosphogluconolactonase
MSYPRHFPFTRQAIGNIASLAATMLLSVAAYARPTVTILSPKTGISGGSPVFFEAYAISPGCGVESMRIVTSPGQGAQLYTIPSGHIETFLAFGPGSHQVSVVAKDGCGNSATDSVTFIIASSPGVTVYLPNQATQWPVHVAASAVSPSCSAGIAAMRIYTDPYITPYTINSDSLDAYVNLVPGSYDFTVQAWDNCGNVFKSKNTQIVTTGADAYLYAGFVNSGSVAEYSIGSDGRLSSPNGTPTPPLFSAGGAQSVAADPGGWYVYASSFNGIYAFQVDRSNGALIPVSGSPFPYFQQVGDQPLPKIIMDPTGNFLYIEFVGSTNSSAALATYRVHRSDGSLAWTGGSSSWGDPSYLQGVTTDFTGQFVYANVNGTDTHVFKTDPNQGALTEESAAFNPGGWPAVAGNRLYLAVEASTPAEILGYSITNGDECAPLSGSPFSAGPPALQSLWADWKGRFLWAVEYPAQGGSADDGIQAFRISPATGNLTSSGAAKRFPSQADGGGLILVEDHTGNFVFSNLSFSASGYAKIVAWKIDRLGNLMKLNAVSPPASVAGDILSIAVVRMAPQ